MDRRKFKERRIFKKVATREEASKAVQDMQEEIHGFKGFQTANDLKKRNSSHTVPF